MRASPLISHLKNRAVYLAEPTIFTGAIPKNVTAKAIAPYVRDTDIYGIAFRTEQLLDALEALGDLDRSALYVAYRLYWSIGNVTPISTGYSTASDTKAAIGIQLAPGTTRLLPLLATPSLTLRTYVLRLLVLFLRGVRDATESDVPLEHLRELIRTFDLSPLLHLATPLQPFEAAWIRWIDDHSQTQQLYKQLTDADAHLVFEKGNRPPSSDIPLYSCRLGNDIVRIGKSYLPHDLRPGHNNPKVVDFYRHPITESSTLLFFDRPMQADDNAEHLYSYFQENYPQYTNAYFALNPASPDWKRLEQAGFRLVKMFSPEFRELFLVSDAVISSQIYNLNHRGKTLRNSRYIYLQHGIQLNNMKDWVLSKYFDIFIATGKLEADYLSEFAPRETLNSGIPRLESLRRTASDERRYLFAPTWRFNLHQLSSGPFTHSNYYRAIDAVLTDPRLLEHLEDHDVTLHVKLHPNIEKRSHLFHFSDHVVHSTLSYREAFATSNFVFTDYSSAVLDAAFLHTPIAYYQWDEEEFFEDQPYRNRLDYRREGLGPVFTEHDEIIDHILNTDIQGTQQEYEVRRERFFEGVDPDRINETIIERMLSL